MIKKQTGRLLVCGVRQNHAGCRSRNQAPQTHRQFLQSDESIRCLPGSRLISWDGRITVSPMPPGKSSLSFAVRDGLGIWQFRRLFSFIRPSLFCPWNRRKPAIAKTAKSNSKRRKTAKIGGFSEKGGRSVIIGLGKNRHINGFSAASKRLLSLSNFYPFFADNRSTILSNFSSAELFSIMNGIPLFAERISVRLSIFSIYPGVDFSNL